MMYFAILLMIHISSFTLGVLFGIKKPNYAKDYLEGFFWFLPEKFK